MLCVICGIRKARRPCPGVRGDICTVCCAEGREETVDCPLDCQYLRAAHRHERPPALDPASLPDQDIEITESFLSANEIIIAFIAAAVHESVLAEPGATDWDVREALAALIRTWRTMQSGLVYESRPDNLYAARIASGVKARIEDLRRREQEATGSALSSVRDADVLGVLAFLERLEYSHNNGRKRCRAFIDFLGSFYVTPFEKTEGGNGTEDAPRIIV